MDYETIKQIMQTPEIIYGAATAVATGILGYTLGRMNSKTKIELAKTNRDIEVAKLEVEGKSYELQRQQALVSVEMRRIELENAEGEHKRDLEKIALQRKYNLEDEGRKEKEATVEHERQKELLVNKHAYRLNLVEKLVSLKPEIAAYLDSIKKNQVSEDLANENKRREYREQLAEEWRGEISDDLLDLNEDFDFNDMNNRLDSLVDLRYPLRQTSQPRLPSELQGLIKLVIEE
jgi:hypothetical protein